jgi:hypothetical protein
VWTEHIGAVSINYLTQQIFNELIFTDFGEAHPTRLRQRVIQLFNTFLFDQQFLIEEQHELIQDALEKFQSQDFSLQTQSPVPSNTSFSEGNYSETRYTDEFPSSPPKSPIQEEITIIDYLGEENSEQTETTSENNTQSDTESIENNQAMGDMNAVITALGNLTNALTAQNARPTEKIIIPIRKYRGNDQDPTEWLRDFNVATQANGIRAERKIQVVRGYLEGTAALWFDERGRADNTRLTAWENNQNQANSFTHQFILKFRTPKRIDQWQDELESLQQTGSVDEYTDQFVNLLRKVDPDNNYPLEYRVRTFRRGLKPEIKKWVQITADGTLENMVEIARNVEKADADSPTRGYHQAQSQSTATMDTLLNALQGLTKRLENLETYQRPNYQRNNQYRGQNNRSANNLIVCYNCGEQGHVRYNCNKPLQ